MIEPTRVQLLGQAGAQLDAARLSADTVLRLKSCLLYNLGMALAGYRDDDVTWKVACGLHAPHGASSLFITGESRAPQDAAFANATLITARGQNDTLHEARGHIGCHVVPAVLALAQQRGASAVTVLSALAAGYETQAAVALGAAGPASRRGLRATSVFGVFGAAAAAARVIQLDAERTTHALAIASSFAAGTMQTWADGSMEWRVQVGQASQSGVVAALLAEGGVTGAPLALEGPAGFYRAFADIMPPTPETTDPSIAPAWTGDAIARVMFKPYPGCAINQGPVHALLGLLRNQAIAAGDVEGIDAWLSPDQYRYPGVASSGPFDTPSGAVMSAAFMLAVALRDGLLLHDHFATEFDSYDVRNRMRFVDVQPDPALPDGSSRVRVRLRDGRTAEASCADQPSFVFGWDATVMLISALAPEISFGDGKRRLAQLTESVQTMDGLSNVDLLMQHMLRQP